MDPDQARRSSGLIWVQTVCQGYQQTTLVDKEVKTLKLKYIIARREQVFDRISQTVLQNI